LVLVTDLVNRENRELDRFTAGIDAVGRGHCLYVHFGEVKERRLVRPLTHAACYYCLGTDNVSLDNYEASTLHFPIKYRPGIVRGRGNWVGYANQDAVDTILCWQPSRRVAPADWDELFSQEPLHIYCRKHQH
jgi:hypothetical protein